MQRSYQQMVFHFSSDYEVNQLLVGAGTCCLGSVRQVPFLGKELILVFCIDVLCTIFRDVTFLTQNLLTREGQHRLPLRVLPPDRATWSHLIKGVTDI